MKRDSKRVSVVSSLNDASLKTSTVVASQTMTPADEMIDTPQVEEQD